MGTSKSYSGPKNGTDLLPSWYSSTSGEGGIAGSAAGSTPEEVLKTETLPQQSQIPIKANDWNAAKSSYTRLRNNPTPNKIHNALRSYVRSSRGHKAIARSAIGGKKTTIRLGGFLRDIVNIGLAKALENLNITDYKGKPVKTVLAMLISVLSPKDGTNEDSIARLALVETIKKLYKEHDLLEKGVDSLSALKEEDINTVIEYYISSYIYQRWTQELGNRIEGKDVSYKKLELMESRCRGFISSKVKNKFSKTSSIIIVKNIEKAINDIYDVAYYMMEGL